MSEEVLFIDDEQTNLLLFDMVFGTKYQVRTADSGKLALNMLAENPGIKVVICDLRMPGMDGFEFIEKAKASYADKIFYILTGFLLDDELKKKLSELNIQGHLSKPFQKELIEEILEGVIASEN